MTAAAASVSTVQLTKVFPSSDGGLVALDRFDLEVNAGEIVALLGPSGCGKSTLLALLAGLSAPTSGRIELDGFQVDNLLGRSAFMPQSNALLPWLRVIDNVTLGLRASGLSRRAARLEAEPVLRRSGLGDFARSYPSELSGGMQQRVAFLRTVLTRRPLMLLDEPFGALDQVTRQQMHAWLLSVWAEAANTVVLVTHDVSEAVHLADRVHVMSPRPGRLAQTIEVALPRPRPAGVEESAEFVRTEVRLRRALREAMHGDAATAGSDGLRRTDPPSAGLGPRRALGRRPALVPHV